MNRVTLFFFSFLFSHFLLFALCTTLGILRLEGVTHPSLLKRVTPPPAPIALETLCTKAVVSDTPPL